ncbi:MAG: cyclic nucleotide-binding domain-containing protein [Spirochaetota bacterium]|jgi:CRP-like cAMP-binding protein|nr:cyclic nucleotide-binding domain-containing protein [Spirochaetota bacterium]
MGNKINRGGTINLADKEVVISQGQSVDALCILTAGKLEMVQTPSSVDTAAIEDLLDEEGYRLGFLSANTFPALDSFITKKPASCSYRAVGPSTISAAPMMGEQQLQAFMTGKPDYAAAMASSLMMTLDAVWQAKTKLQRIHNPLSVMTENAGVYYWALRDVLTLPTIPKGHFFKTAEQNIAALRRRDVPVKPQFDTIFMEADHSALFDSERMAGLLANQKQVEYYRRMLRMAPPLRKAFFTADAYVTLYTCQDISACLGHIYSDIESLIDRLDDLFIELYHTDKESIFTEFAHALREVIKQGSASLLPSQIIDYLKFKTTGLLQDFEESFGKKPEIDFGYFDRVIQQVDSPDAPMLDEPEGLPSDIADLLSMDSKEPTDTGGVVQVATVEPAAVIDISSLPPELKNSLKRILDFSGIAKEKATAFTANIESFRKLKDKASPDDSIRKLRRSITTVYYEIYEEVFKRMFKERTKDRLMDMFINFGFMDERLLDPASTMKLFTLQDPAGFNSTYPVYTMFEWLSAIYKREKEPSIDEFGNDYMGVFREMKKSGDITDAQKTEYENNLDKRLHHEINNMVKTSQRLCYGQLAIYVPILYQDMFVRALDQAFVTRRSVADEVRKLLETDYSAFHREVLCRKPEAGIEREFVMRGTIPDFILSHTFGSRQFMWQDLVGKDKRSPARIILPIFCSEDLENLIVDGVGALRWELCKTMLGASWNDVSQSSLTADYSDYIQFYRKNRDLSDESKDKIKQQIQSCRNNMRDIFVSDYRLWIKYESHGVLRLNKVVRGILYRHCSFAKNLRAQLEKQPMYTDIAVRFENIRNRKVTEITNRYHRYTKTGAELDPELADHLNFYKDL